MNLQKAGKIKEAIAIYSWFLPLLELDINPKLVQNIKLAEVAYRNWNRICKSTKIGIGR